MLLSSKNRVLFAFFGVLALMIVGSVQFLESKFVASKIRKEIQKHIPNELDINFENLEFGYLPPRISLKNFTLNLDQKTKIHANVDRLSLEYSPIDIIVGRPVVSNLLIDSAEVEIKTVDDKKKDEEIDLVKVFDDYQKFISSLPVYFKRLTLNNNLLTINEEQIIIEKIQTVLLSSSIFINSEISGNVSKLIFKKELFDSVGLDAQISTEGLKIRKLNVLKGFESFGIHGETKGLGNFRTFTGAIDFQSGLPEIANIVEKIVNKKIPDLQGYAQGQIEILEGKLTRVDLLAHDLITEFATANELTSNIKILDGAIQVEKLKANMNLGGTVELLEPVQINVSADPFTSELVKLQLNRAHSNDFLYIAKKDLAKLHTVLSAKIALQFLKEKTTVKTIDSGNGEFVKLFSTDGKTILDFKNYSFKKAQFDIDRRGGGLILSGQAGWGDGDFSFEGIISKQQIDIRSTASKIKLEQLGQFGNAKIDGEMNLGIHVVKNENEEKIYVKGNGSDFSVQEYYLGSVDTEFYIDLKNKKLKVQSMQGNAFQTDFIGNAELSLDGSSDFNIQLDKLSGTRLGFEKIFYPLVKKLKIPEDLTYVYSGWTKVYKKGDAGVNVNASFGLKTVSYLNEVLEDGQVDLTFREDVLKVERLNLKKSRSPIVGSGYLNTKTEYFELDLGGSKIPLSSFTNYSLLNLGLRCNLSFEFYGSGVPSENNLRLQSRLDDCNSSGKPIRESSITFYKTKDNLLGSGRFLGEDIQFKLNAEGDLSSFPRGELKAFINIKNIENHFSALSEHNARNSNLSGDMLGEFHLQFDGKEFSNLSTSLDVKKLLIKNGSREIRIDEPQQYKIVRGEIYPFDTKIESSGLFAELHGEGNLNNDFELTSKGSFDASFLQLISSDIESASGQINFKNRLARKNGTIDSNYNATGSSFNLKYKNIPVPFSDIGIRANLVNNILLIEELSANMGKGKLNGSGRIVAKLPFPAIDVQLQGKQINIPIHHKSSIFTNSDFNLTGSVPPYLLKGNIEMYYASIEDELSDIPYLKSFEGDYNDLVPRSAGTRGTEILNLDLKIFAANDFRIRNSLMDITLSGNAGVNGGLAKPNYDVQMSMVSGRSKVILKGHEFIISKGKVVAKDDGFDKQVEIDVDAFSRVQNYDLRLLASGPISRLKIDLTSSPSLSQEDIVSLLTLGVTSDVSKGLSDKDRTSITTMGVGSLLFDQLKINQNLNSSMGLKLSLQPEFKKQEENLFQSRSDTTSDVSAGYKSSTKLKVQKQITPKMDMSLSSSLGTNTDQSQEMNINYQLNKDLSVEGIYEFKSDEQSENVGQESVGADIKYKWSW